MGDSDRPIKPGLYRINWRTGGRSLAAVGVDRNGARWLAPINWVSPFVPGLSSSNAWHDVESYERIDPDAGRDRDALLAAVSMLACSGKKTIGALTVAAGSQLNAQPWSSAMAPPGFSGNTFVVTGRNELPVNVVVVAYIPEHDANPELLERASTMLAERYIEETKGGPK